MYNSYLEEVVQENIIYSIRSNEDQEKSTDEQ